MLSKITTNLSEKYSHTLFCWDDDYDYDDDDLSYEDIERIDWDDMIEYWDEHND